MSVVDLEDGMYDYGITVSQYASNDSCNIAPMTGLALSEEYDMVCTYPYGDGLTLTYQYTLQAHHLRSGEFINLSTDPGFPKFRVHWGRGCQSFDSATANLNLREF